MQEKKNSHKYKLTIFQVVLISLFVLFIIFILIPKKYNLEYKVNDIIINETFNKKDKAYYFTLEYNNKAVDILIEHKYIHKRRLIKDIEIIEDKENNAFCLNIESEKLDINPLCFENDKQVAYFNSTLRDKLSKEYQSENKTLLNTYNDINIYNDSAIYLVWNYNGFYYINKDITKKIDIFSKEFYSLNSAGYTKDYLVIPNMDDNYTFNKIYTIDAKKGNLKSYEVKNSIYFESYFPGFIKNDLYIVDTKERVMYEFNAKNGYFEKVKNRIYEKGSWNDISMNTLINNKTMFNYNTNYIYTLDDGYLYLNYNNKEIKTLISSNVSKIIKVDNDIVYYLKKDELYRYNKEGKEELLLSYSEWLFNNEGAVYIF